MDKKLEEILNCVNPEILEVQGADLVEEGIIDSLAIMQIVSALEEGYGIEFDPDDIMPETFASAAAIEQTLQRYLSAKA